MSTKPSTDKELIDFMKSLRTHFINNYPVDYVVGSLYSNNTSITYFPFTHKALKEQKLKIALVYNHPRERFEVWLAGQNKQVQKKYWQLFKDSDWNKYHIPRTPDEGFSIVDTVLVEKPNFSDILKLTKNIEEKTLIFTMCQVS